MAVPLPSRHLQAIFGFFLMLSAGLLWRKTNGAAGPSQMGALPMAGIFFTAMFCGVAAGLVGIGGGVLMVPLLGLLFGFSQHKAQGTSVVALIPPTGLLAYLVYWKAGYVNWHTGMLLIPGVFLGGILGGIVARQLNPRRMRLVFAALMFLLGAWQIFSARGR
jgi:uncharacterized membrane protein YfcA